MEIMGKVSDRCRHILVAIELENEGERGREWRGW